MGQMEIAEMQSQSVHAEEAHEKLNKEFQKLQEEMTDMKAMLKPPYEKEAIPRCDAVHSRKLDRSEVPCKFFLRGACSRGDIGVYSHAQEVRKSEQLVDWPVADDEDVFHDVAEPEVGSLVTIAGLQPAKELNGMV